MTTFLVLVGCRPEPATDSGDTNPLQTSLPTTLPVPPTFDPWSCPIVPAEPRDAWVLRNAYIDSRSELSTIDVMMQGNLDPDLHTSCPISGTETSCAEGVYLSLTGVLVDYHEVVSHPDADTQTRVIDALLTSEDWELDWHSEWDQHEGSDGATETDELWDLSWDGKPLTTLPSNTALDATSFSGSDGEFPVDALTWAFDDCAWSVLDQRDRPSDGELYAITVQDTEVTVELAGERWLASIDGVCVGEIDSLSWAILGPC